MRSPGISKEGREPHSKRSDKKRAMNSDISSIYRGYLRLAILKCLEGRGRDAIEISKCVAGTTCGDLTPSTRTIEALLEEQEKANLVERRPRSGKYTLTHKGRGALAVLYEGLRAQMDFIDWLMEREPDG